jgi:hypothetical protein
MVISYVLSLCFCWTWSGTGNVSELSVCELDLNYLLLLLYFELGTVITLYLNSDVFRLCANFMYHVNGECWTMYDLGWDVKKFEILHDFTDYRVYADSCMRFNCSGRCFLYLSSYKLGGSVTAGIGAQFSMLLFICVFETKGLCFTKLIVNL